MEIENLITLTNIVSAKYLYDMDGNKNCINVDLGNNNFCNIPLDTDNQQYKEIMDWANQGNTIIDNPPSN